MTSKTLLNFNFYKQNTVLYPISHVPNEKYTRSTKFSIDHYGPFCGELQLVLFWNKNMLIDWKNVVSKLIDSIDVDIGGYTINTIYGSNIYDLLKLYQLEIKQYDTSNHQCLIIPLPFDMFIGSNVFPLIKLETRSLTIRVRYTKLDLFDVLDSELHVNYYHQMGEKFPMSAEKIKTPEIQALIDRKIDITFNASQYCGAESVTGKMSKYKMNFNHGVKFLYFHFADKNTFEPVSEMKLSKVNLQFDGRDHYLSEMYKLKHDTIPYKLMNYTYVIPLSEYNGDIHENVSNSVINFSKIETAVLGLIFEQDVDCIINIYASVFSRIMFGEGVDNYDIMTQT